MSTSEPVPPRTIGRDGKSYPSRRKPKPVITPKPDVEPARTTEDCAQPGNSGRNQDGTFAKNFIAENESGRKKFDAIRKEEAKHPIEEVGAKLRAAMPFLDPVTVKDNTPQAAQPETVKA